MNQNIISLFLFLLLTISFAGGVKAQEKIHLFPEKSFAVSGDTLWFGVFIYNENQEEISQVVHVQLNDAEKKHILKVSVLCQGAFGEGFILIPDSLSTGVYVLNPFSLVQKNSEFAVINQKFINVYNRFDEDISFIQKPDLNIFEEYTQDKKINIKTDKEKYRRGEKVQVSFDISQERLNDFQKVFVIAGISDPISEKYIYSISQNQSLTNTETPVILVEKNGVLITGKVTDNFFGNPVSKSIVLLSIPDSIPFFDYCVSDENGMFYFYLRNAVGTADLIFQALTKNDQECRIELTDSYIEVQKDIVNEKMLTIEEEKFAKEIVEASFFDKFFNRNNINYSEYFSKSQQFDFPIYGEPTRTFEPDLFIDLPDFQEISREILQGVQYRERKDEITIRLLDLGSNTIFKEEPLRLLDGIPVFNNEVFKPLSTDEIQKVDVVFYERFYGDLSFQGILSVYTKNRSLDWVDSDPNIAHIKYTCLQPPKKFNFKNKVVSNTNVPDLNKVLFRSSFDGFETNNKFDFFTSDITGDVEIRLILIDKNNQIKYCHKLIKVE